MLELPLDPVRVPISRRHVSFAIRNLIRNAIAFSPPDSVVAVRVAFDDATTTISVHDQGSRGGRGGRRLDLRAVRPRPLRSLGASGTAWASSSSSASPIRTGAGCGWTRARRGRPSISRCRSARAKASGRRGHHRSADRRRSPAVRRGDQAFTGAARDDRHARHDGTRGIGDRSPTSTFDLVLVDLGLPDMRGIDVGARILELRRPRSCSRSPRSTMSRHVAPVLQAGFRGYLTKDLRIAGLVSAINAAIDGTGRDARAVHQLRRRVQDPIERAHRADRLDAHPSGAGGPRAARRGCARGRHRARDVDQRQHRADARPEHPHEAAGALQTRGRDVRRAPRPRARRQAPRTDGSQSIEPTGRVTARSRARRSEATSCIACGARSGRISSPGGGGGDDD